eukprot:g2939.t1
MLFYSQILLLLHSFHFFSGESTRPQLRSRQNQSSASFIEIFPGLLGFAKSIQLHSDILDTNYDTMDTSGDVDMMRGGDELLDIVNARNKKEALQLLSNALHNFGLNEFHEPGLSIYTDAKESLKGGQAPDQDEESDVITGDLGGVQLTRLGSPGEGSFSTFYTLHNVKSAFAHTCALFNCPEGMMQRKDSEKCPCDGNRGQANNLNEYGLPICEGQEEEEEAGVATTEEADLNTEGEEEALTPQELNARLERDNERNLIYVKGQCTEAYCCIDDGQANGTFGPGQSLGSDTMCDDGGSPSKHFDCPSEMRPKTKEEMEESKGVPISASTSDSRRRLLALTLSEVKETSKALEPERRFSISMVERCCIFRSCEDFFKDEKIDIANTKNPCTTLYERNETFYQKVQGIACLLPRYPLTERGYSFQKCCVPTASEVECQNGEERKREILESVAARKEEKIKELEKENDPGKLFGSEFRANDELNRDGTKKGEEGEIAGEEIDAHNFKVDRTRSPQNG